MDETTKREHGLMKKEHELLKKELDLVRERMTLELKQQDIELKRREHELERREQALESSTIMSISFDTSFFMELGMTDKEQIRDYILKAVQEKKQREN